MSTALTQSCSTAQQWAGPKVIPLQRNAPKAYMTTDFHSLGQGVSTAKNRIFTCFIVETESTMGRDWMFFITFAAK